ncbi:ribonuclease III [Intestinibacillus massiliensis]|nr:ribonuclease III [Intestinibacillus massiliensis]
MQDFLHPILDKPALDRLGVLALAHIGDSVYELLTRTHLAACGTQTARNLHRRTVALVCAPAQARAAQAVLPALDEEEAAVFRHGRNAKPGTVPRSCSVRDYSQATALEALFGWLYLAGHYDRVNELYGLIAADYGTEG